MSALRRMVRSTENGDLRGTRICLAESRSPTDQDLGQQAEDDKPVRSDTSDIMRIFLLNFCQGAL